MDGPFDQLVDASSALPADQRAELACFLLRTLGPEDPGLSQAWQAELARRSEEIHSGKVKGIPADAAFAELRKRFP